MRIAITGSTGLVGTALVPALEKAGHEVVRLVRKKGIPGIYWDPETGEIDVAGLEGIEGVIHLAGESIAARRWDAEEKKKIRESRVQGTRLLVRALTGLKQPPSVLTCASAVGYYGHRGDEVLREESPSGTGFLAEVCRDWEAAAQEASQKGIRVCHTRFGMILSPQGGALAKILPPFKMGVGGVIGNGRQYWSWIGLDDVVGILIHSLKDSLIGAVNAVAPQAVTNREFTKTLGRVLRRPTFLPLPAFAARLLLGEMADELLLASARAEPARLKVSGYEFSHPDLEGCLRAVLGR